MDMEKGYRIDYTIQDQEGDDVATLTLEVEKLPSMKAETLSSLLYPTLLALRLKMYLLGINVERGNQRIGYWGCTAKVDEGLISCCFD